jgi:hypothetical protein
VPVEVRADGIPHAARRDRDGYPRGDRIARDLRHGLDERRAVFHDVVREFFASRRHRVEVRRRPLLFGEDAEDLSNGHAGEVVELLLRHGHSDLLARLAVREVERAHRVHERPVAVWRERK